jgi:hypothetical protein
MSGFLRKIPQIWLHTASCPASQNPLTAHGIACVIVHEHGKDQLDGTDGKAYKNAYLSKPPFG